MKKAVLSVLAVGAAVVGSGCVTARAPAVGVLYTDVQGGVSATSNQTGNRTGEACLKSFFGIVATGDASIETARRNGGITMITSVDEQMTNVLGFATYCTVVRGR